MFVKRSTDLLFFIENFFLLLKNLHVFFREGERENEGKSRRGEKLSKGKKRMRS